ncbi:99_t:CDS:1, partial [Racocetra fulgida]
IRAKCYSINSGIFDYKCLKDILNNVSVQEAFLRKDVGINRSENPIKVDD